METPAGAGSAAAPAPEPSGAPAPEKAARERIPRPAPTGIVLYPVLSAGLLALGYFPLGLLLPNLVGFLPLLAWLDSEPRAPARRAFKGGSVFGVVLNGIILYWIYSMLAVSWLAAVLYAFLVSVFGAGAMVSTGLASWLRNRTGWPWAVVLPVCWLPVEWAFTWGDTRMTAHHLGHTLAGYPFLVQFADIVGPYGVGAFLLVVNGLLYEAVRRGERARRVRSGIALAGLLVVVVGYDAWAWTRPPNSEGTLRVALVQPNIPLFVKMDPGTDALQWEVLRRVTAEAARTGKPDLIVWPETARPAMLVHRLDRPASYAMPEVQALARQLGVPVIVGAEYAQVEPGRAPRRYNAALLVHADGRLDPTWTAKLYLVPFVEAIPFEPVLGRLLGGGRGELRWMAGGFTAPAEPRLLAVGGARIGVLVCYEELYFDLARQLRNRGASFQAIITNDAWFGRTLFQQYQSNTVRLRAIENRSAFVRVANTGISGFVDPLGRYHRETELFVPAVETWEVPLTSRRTVYDRAGDVVAWLAIGGLGAGLLVSVRNARGSR